MVTQERKLTVEQLSEVMGNSKERRAYTLSEVAEMLGLEKRRMKGLFERKKVPMFWFGNRQMITAATLNGILDGTIDVGTPPERRRDIDGLFVAEDGETTAAE